jgi:hypothetical protein
VHTVPPPRPRTSELAQPRTRLGCLSYLRTLPARACTRCSTNTRVVRLVGLGGGHDSAHHASAACWACAAGSRSNLPRSIAITVAGRRTRECKVCTRCFSAIAACRAGWRSRQLGLSASSSKHHCRGEDALESARQVKEGEAFAGEIQASLSQENGVLDRTIQIKEDGAFARELAGGEDEDEGRDISLPSASATSCSCLSPTSGRCGGGEGTASCDECVICMNQLRLSSGPSQLTPATGLDGATSSPGQSRLKTAVERPNRDWHYPTAQSKPNGL